MGADMKDFCFILLPTGCLELIPIDVLVNFNYFRRINFLFLIFCFTKIDHTIIDAEIIETLPLIHLS